MVYWAISISLLVAARFVVGSDAVVWLLLASQLALLANEVRRKQVSGVGGFIFLSVLFFGMRPLYVFIEKDFANIVSFFRLDASPYQLADAMWWATLALLCFALGARIAPAAHRKWLARRAARARELYSPAIATAKMCLIGIVLQVFTLPFMLYLASMKRTVYQSDLGAYFYDLPLPLQAVHVFALVLTSGRFRKYRTLQSGMLLACSLVLALFYTFLMRDVSMFRGFYLSGLMIAGLAVLHQFKPRVGYAWLILPIVLLQPLFAYLGSERGKTNEQLLEEGTVAEAIAPDEGLLPAYWHFYNGAGDMNIFDTFVAAKQTQPRFYPYAWSWLYVSVHWVPRKVWITKPKRGTTQDMSFNRGAPLSPGIAGFFLRDGGLLWMVLSMTLLGYFVSLIDCCVLTMPRGSMRSCLVGIVVVNAMFLSRLFLWQYFYQILYTFLVVVVLVWWMRRFSTRETRPSIIRSGRHGMPMNAFRYNPSGGDHELPEK